MVAGPWKHAPVTSRGTTFISASLSFETVACLLVDHRIVCRALEAIHRRLEDGVRMLGGNDFVVHLPA